MSDEPMKPGDEAPAGEPAAGENTCEACGGTGREDGGTCPECQGTGEVREAVGGG
jgi:DnaJ-class molecular chaperone